MRIYKINTFSPNLKQNSFIFFILFNFFKNFLINTLKTERENVNYLKTQQTSFHLETICNRKYKKKKRKIEN